MKLFATIVSLAFLSACCEKEDLTTSLCILEKIEAFKLEGLGVYSYEINGKNNYWFHTGAMHYDGSEYIYNENCEVTCYYCGECAPPGCLGSFPPYLSDQWTLVWKK